MGIILRLKDVYFNNPNLPTVISAVKTNLAAFWRFGTYQDNLNADVENTNGAGVLTQYGTPTYEAFAASLDNTNFLITTIAVPTSAWTIMATVKFTSALSFFFAGGNNNANVNNDNIRLLIDDGFVMASWTISGDQVVVQTSETLVQDQWYIVSVSKASDGTITTTNHTTGETASGTIGTLVNTLDWWIGSTGVEILFVDDYTGQIAEIGIWNAALSTAQKAEQYGYMQTYMAMKDITV